jgi:hypothetical protein
MCTSFLIAIRPELKLISIFNKSEITIYKYPLLKFNSTAFLLPLAFKDGVLTEINILK